MEPHSNPDLLTAQGSEKCSLELLNRLGEEGEGGYERLGPSVYHKAALNLWPMGNVISCGEVGRSI